MHLKPSLLFLTAIVGVSILGGLVLSGFFLEEQERQRVLSQAELKSIAIEFLNNTIICDSGSNVIVEIKEIIDYVDVDGKFVMVLNYTTCNAGHPNFVLEAVEHHTAIIKLTTDGNVVSALCVWGSFHKDRIWDLLDQKWIE